MTDIELQLQRYSPGYDFSKEAGWGDWLRVGASMIPGVGTVMSGMDAFNDFRQGNIWSGLGNLGMAGLGLIPGVGSVGAGLARGAKALGGASRLARGLNTTANLANRAGTMVSKVAPTGLTNVLTKGTPGKAMAARFGSQVGSGVAGGAAQEYANANAAPPPAPAPAPAAPRPPQASAMPPGQPPRTPTTLPPRGQALATPKPPMAPPAPKPIGPQPKIVNSRPLTPASKAYSF